MAKKTLIKFIGAKEQPYPGATRASCMPTDPEAVFWHAVVGGVQCSFKNAEEFASHFHDFMTYAYDAGVADTKADLKERLGLE